MPIKMFFTPNKVGSKTYEIEPPLEDGETRVLGGVLTLKGHPRRELAVTRTGGVAMVIWGSDYTKPHKELVTASGGPFSLTEVILEGGGDPDTGVLVFESDARPYKLHEQGGVENGEDQFELSDTEEYLKI